jgi:peroxiredoxin-like protein
MKDLSFETRLSWSDTGHGGIGNVRTDQIAVTISGPESMGGRGFGTNPEELLVAAVASCYIATFFGVLKRRKLPVESLLLSATGVVTDFPSHARFAGVTVSPTICGGDDSRQDEYEAAAARAHDRCLIGRALSDQVTYEVGPVDVRRPASEPGHSHVEGTPEQTPAWRAA